MNALTQCLDDLERRIDSDAETALWKQWESYWQGECGEPLFKPSVRRGAPPGFEWPAVHINDAIGDDELTVISQLCGVSDTLAAAESGTMLSVRSNYGVGILSSIFGAELFMMPREQRCLPNSRALEGGTAGVEKAVAAGVPDLWTGLGARVLDTGARFVEAFDPYPKVREHVHIYHPDLQGPMDVAELLWGSGIFLELYDSAELVHQFLALICDTYVAFMKEWWKIAPPKNDLNVHWSQVWKGKIVLRDDSAMNLSGDMFETFILPYDERFLCELGGGGIHACGKVDHWVEPMSRIKGLTGLNMSQPSYNDMETVYRHTVDKGIHLVNLDRRTADQAVASGRDLRGLAQC